MAPLAKVGGVARIDAQVRQHTDAAVRAPALQGHAHRVRVVQPQVDLVPHTKKKLGWTLDRERIVSFLFFLENGTSLLEPRVRMPAK